MKLTRMLPALTLIFGVAYPAFADHSAKELKVLNDSATALSSVNPDLSGRLSQFAQKESTEKESDERVEAGHSGDVQLLTQAADALNGARPDLAKGLRRYAGKESREEGMKSPSSKSMKY